MVGGVARTSVTGAEGDEYMIGGVARTSVMGAEGDEDGVPFPGVSTRCVHGDCWEGVGCDKSRGVEV